MRALSIRQPHAQAILAGMKLIEYRSWPTAHRGLLLIHAGKALDREALADYPALDVASLARGALVGAVDLVEVEPDGTGGFAWSLASPRRLMQPIPYPGRLGLFVVDDSLVSELTSGGDR